eukprot:6878672-Heterocapsa_arctica.AAC.1
MANTLCQGGRADWEGGAGQGDHAGTRARACTGGQQAGKPNRREDAEGRQLAKSRRVSTVSLKPSLHALFN